MQWKKCPYCGENITFVAKKCKYCGEWINGTASVNPVPQYEYEQAETNIKEEKTTQPNNQWRVTKQCPFCCQKVPINAKKCQYCGEWIEEKEQKQQKENSVYKVSQFIIGTIVVIIGVLLECATNGGGAGMVFALFAFIILGIYFLPATIADSKHHKNTTAIFVVNLFFGWTFIGWVAALVWAVTEER